jgi:molybdopterin-binding protein
MQVRSRRPAARVLLSLLRGYALAARRRRSACSQSLPILALTPRRRLALPQSRSVVAFTLSEAIANVELDVAGQRLVASITVEAMKDLGLQAGAEVLAVVKAPDVMIATT